MTITPKVRNGIFIGLGAVALIVIGTVIYNKVKIVENSPEGFNGVVAKGKRNHPGVYAWWEALPIDKQIQIESMMTSETLTFLDKEFGKTNLSQEAKDFLKKAGYTA